MMLGKREEIPKESREEKKMRNITEGELKNILHKHKRWLLEY